MQLNDIYVEGVTGATVHDARLVKFAIMHTNIPNSYWCRNIYLWRHAAFHNNLKYMRGQREVKVESDSTK